MTYLQLINAVLVRLREDTVASVPTSGYNYLIANFVNEAKRDVEDAWNWAALRTTASITTTASTATYSVAGTNERTRLLDVYNTTSKGMMGKYDNNVYINNINTLAPTTGSPDSYDIVGIDYADSDKLKVRLYPTPDGAYSITLNCVVPQDDLSASGDILRVPHNPVIQLAYLKALIERGEDGGRLSEMQQGLFQQTLSTAIAHDAEYFADELTWRTV